MNRDFLTEAFRSMNIINEEAFDVDMKGAEEAEDFLDKDEYELLTVIDDEAKDEEEIKTDYTGKVIIECNTCHSKLFKGKEDIKIEDDIVNKDEECPYCNSLDGYAIIGQIAPYEEKEEDKVNENLTVGESLNDSIAVKMSRDDFDRMCRENGILQGLNRSDYIEIRDSFYVGYENFDAAVNDLWDGDDGYHSRDWYEDLLKKYINNVNESKSIKESEDKDIITAWWADQDEKTKEDFAKWTWEHPHLYNDILRFSKLHDKSVVDKVKEAGLQIVKDKYGDYQVIAGKYNEKLVESLYAVIEDDGTYAGSPCESYDEARDLAAQHKGAKIFSLIFKQAGDYQIDDDEYDEKLNESKKPSKKFIKEQIKRNKKSLRERLEEISVKTDDNKIEVIEDEEGKVTVTSEPACKEHCEVIKEVPEEVKDEIIDNQKEDSADVDVDIDEIDTDTFGDLTERYFKKTYGNVKCFECKSSKKNNNKIVVEGFITFNSGNKKATQFIFEGYSMDKKGKMKLIGENKQLSNGKKSFVIRGHQDNNKVVCESLNYRYNQNNKMIRGSIKNI